MYDQPFIKIKEASHVANVDVSTLRTWVRKGYLTERRTVTGHRVFDRTELLQFVAGNVVASGGVR